eukprot:1620965-Alexandrium_andersonii.AAC.1
MPACIHAHECMHTYTYAGLAQSRPTEPESARQAVVTAGARRACQVRFAVGPGAEEGQPGEPPAMASK